MATLVLSRYAILRRDGGLLVAEAGRSGARVVIEDPRALGLLHTFAEPAGIEDAAARAGVGPADADNLVRPLVNAGILVDPGTAAREEASLWQLDDVRFHARTRVGRVGPFPPPDAPPAPPALPGERWEPAVDLPVPDFDTIERDDPPLAAVQTARLSWREPGPRPLALAELGTFLYRVGRVEDVWQYGPTDIAARPYPAAGALYELELHVVAADCEGVERGLYHYESDFHRLARAPGDAGAADALVAAAARGIGVAHEPQALIVIGARFDRIAFKYRDIAYALMLKNVGVVLQTMYLVATAMGLGPCAVGTGDAALFGRATGLDPEARTSVGEFCLSTRQPSGARPRQR